MFVALLPGRSGRFDLFDLSLVYLFGRFTESFRGWFWVRVPVTPLSSVGGFVRSRRSRFLMAYRYEATEKFWAGFYALGDAQKDNVREDVSILRKAANQSAIDKVSARDSGEHRAERKMDVVVGRVRSAVETKARQIRRKVLAALERRREMIRELRLKKRRAEALAAERKRNWGMSIHLH